MLRVLRMHNLKLPPTNSASLLSGRKIFTVRLCHCRALRLYKLPQGGVKTESFNCVCIV